jgi:sugar phosphate isomerase/epimerase
MIAEIAALGFTHVELSHGIRLSLVPGMVRALEEGLVQVSSTHNFCPLPPGVNSAAPNLFTPSSADERIIMQWDRYTRRSIDFAKQVGASVMVTHLGDVEFGWGNPAKNVHAVMESRNANTDRGLEKLQKAAADCVNKAKKRKDEYWDRVISNLDYMVPIAKENGLTIGAEVREKCVELPFDSDFPALLERFPNGSGLAYWHDVGHAHLKEKMGIIDHEEHLGLLADRLAGFHVHDVNGFKDHQPPGTGEIDFEMVAQFMKPEHIFVLELHPRLSPTEISEARDFLEGLVGVPA